MIKTTLLVILGLAVLAIAVVLLLATRQPDSFRVERTASIAAPPERIFPLVNDLRQMNSWNPFVKMDPDASGSYSGPAAGLGAVYDFRGRNSGSMRITQANAPSRVTMDLHMTGLMETHNTVNFELTPQDGSTRVTWSMEGAQPFLAKVMGVVFNMDQMVGGAFEAGLSDLKTQAEKT
ncbi:SRPBCC family protein [Polaromonas sp.]|uniref:SRPBCC family protein n=1 Tax=Polaromonas sp. TaxID=1869339 RepID=UPI00326630D0